MLVHPQFNPIAFSLGPVAVRWYGLMYVLGFIAFITLGKLRVRRGLSNGITARDVDDMILYGVFGVILGGRLGYVLFYKPDYYLAHPMEVFQVWMGGMSFHGGFIGVMLAIALFCRLRKLRWITTMDFIAPMVPLGLMAGRIGNFINGELPGRATTVPWGMWFPQTDREPVARHPSQLYEASLEGLTLFIILWWYSSRPRPPGAVAGAFLLGYGCFRFLVEFTRAPDDYLGLLALNLSMGQWLSLPMIVAGLAMMIWAYRVNAARAPSAP